MSNVTESLDDDVLQLQTAQDTSGDDVIRDEMVKGTVVLRRLHLFESWDKLVLVGSNKTGKYFKMLKFDRNVEEKLVVTEEHDLFDAKGAKSYLGTLNESLEKQGGLRLVSRFDAFLGCVKIWAHYYLVFVKNSEPAGIIAGRHIYHVKETVMIPLIALNKKAKIAPEELKYRELFESISSDKNDFYFSFSYDLTNTLQYNYIDHSSSEDAGSKFKYNEKYLWNYYMANNFLNSMNRSYWIVPLIHGFFEQKAVRVGTQVILISLLARRSRHFAGTRYNRRGISSSGDTANEVETEQIVGIDKPWILGGGTYSSFVMLRGSIPLYWKQTNPLSPKPEISIYKKEDDYYTTRLHFDKLFAQYGSPLIILNLIRKNEKKAQETVVGCEFESAISELAVHYKKKTGRDILSYLSYDFLSEMKVKNNVTQDLFRLSSTLVELVGCFFHPSSPKKFHSFSQNQIKRSQAGVIRVNCIDCLDRTNIAQFCLGLAVLGNQLLDLKVIDELIDWETKYGDLMNILQKMYTKQGDRIANQYGGSAAMHKSVFNEKSSTSDLAKIGNAFTAVKRYYANNFLDVEKQHAINIFLGSFISAPDKTHIWDMDTEKTFEEIYFHYPLEANLFEIPFAERSSESVGSFDTYFNERYDPYNLTNFDAELERSYNLPIEAKIQSSEHDFVSISQAFRQSIENSFSSEFANSQTFPEDSLVSSNKSSPDKSNNEMKTSSVTQMDHIEAFSLPGTSNSQKSFKKPQSHTAYDETEQQYASYVQVENFITNSYVGISSSTNQLEPIIQQLREDIKQLLEQQNH